jgi:hypothetical protein
MTEMATPQVGAILADLTEREFYRLVETDRVLVCLNSLPGYQKNEGSAERS